MSAVAVEADPLDFTSTTTNRDRIIPLDDFLRETFEDTEWLVEDVIPLAGLIQFLGKPESFKTMGLLTLHIAAAYGINWLGRTTTPTTSVYVSNEKRRRSVHERLDLATRTVEQDHKRQKDIFVLHRSGLRIDAKNDQWNRLVDFVHELDEPVVVSLDTITSLAPTGFKENTGESWEVVLGAMRMLTNLPKPATVLGSFHPSKADTGGVSMSSRGHGSFDGEADGALTFNRPDRAADEGVIHARPKDGSYQIIPFAFDLDSRMLTARGILGTALTIENTVEIVKQFQNPSLEQIRLAFGKDASTGRFRFGEEKVREKLREAIEEGYIQDFRPDGASANTKKLFRVTDKAVPTEVNWYET